MSSLFSLKTLGMNHFTTVLLLQGTQIFWLQLCQVKEKVPCQECLSNIKSSVYSPPTVAGLFLQNTIAKCCGVDRSLMCGASLYFLPLGLPV